MSAPASIAGRAAWLTDSDMQRLLSALSRDGEAARFAGGAVRDAMLGEAGGDIDIATTTLPDETIRRAEAAGFRTVPTGIDHGTITVLVHGRPVEVTTLRADVDTDGRHARVAFGRGWQADAERRDFTINGLYAEADGTVVDFVGGVDDLQTRTVRFIGDPDRRIREDYLRILRFFRFFARFGTGRPDADGLRACARLKDGLDRLSAERVWAELKKTLAVADPSRALLWMRQAGVLTRVLPESEKWGIDAIQGLVAADRDLGWTPDPLLRIAAIVPPDAERMKALAERLRLSKAEAERLVGWAQAPAPKPETSEAALARQLYATGAAGTIDRLRLALAAARAKAMMDTSVLIQAGGFARQLAFAEGWKRPTFPVGGEEMKTLGVPPGPEMGARLAALERDWIASGFALDRAELLRRAAEAISAPGEPR